MSNQLINVNLCGYLPRFGSGWRTVEVLRTGKKCVQLRYAPRNLNDPSRPLTVRRGKLPVDVWERLPKRTIGEKPMTYVITYTNPSASTVIETEAPESITKDLAEDVSAVTVEVQEDLKRLPTAALVALYNAAYPTAPVAKFESKAIGARRVFPVLSGLATAPVVEASDEPVPTAAKSNGSPAKGKNLGVIALIRQRLAAGDDTETIIAALREQIPESRAGKNEIAWVRNQEKRGRWQ